MVLLAPSSAPRQSEIPTFSGFFQILIKQRGTETRVSKLVYFNKDRGCFYAVLEGDSDQKFRGPEAALSVVGVVQGNAIRFPSNRDYEIAETILPVNSDSNEVSNQTKSALEIALSAQKPVGIATATFPGYFPETGKPPLFGG